MLPNPARRFHEKKFISHSGGVQKMDNHKQIFGKARTCQEILNGLKGGFKWK